MREGPRGSKHTCPQFLSAYKSRRATQTSTGPPDPEEGNKVQTRTQWANPQKKIYRNITGKGEKKKDRERKERKRPNPPPQRQDVLPHLEKKRTHWERLLGNELST